MRGKSNDNTLQGLHRLVSWWWNLVMIVVRCIGYFNSEYVPRESDTVKAIVLLHCLWHPLEIKSRTLMLRLRQQDTVVRGSSHKVLDTFMTGCIQAELFYDSRNYTFTRSRRDNFLPTSPCQYCMEGAVFIQERNKKKAQQNYAHSTGCMLKI